MANSFARVYTIKSKDTAIIRQVSSENRNHSPGEKPTKTDKILNWFKIKMGKGDKNTDIFKQKIPPTSPKETKGEANPLSSLEDGQKIILKTKIPLKLGNIFLLKLLNLTKRANI